MKNTLLLMMLVAVGMIAMAFNSGNTNFVAQYDYSEMSSFASDSTETEEAEEDYSEDEEESTESEDDAE